MPIGPIWLITTQKVLKTWSVKSMEQHYLGSNHHDRVLFCREFGAKANRVYIVIENLMLR